MGGIGSAVIEFMADNGYNSKVKRLGIPDAYIEHGEPHELWKECGFDEESILNEIIEISKKEGKKLKKKLAS
jgi:1-deoxy-D-xylulose-5-phosphate synthase